MYLFESVCETETLQILHEDTIHRNELVLQDGMTVHQ